ncbi:hypothetical protein BGW36DRAFT_303366 [Talaromyces proteolyticus]|uniref:CSC1/OSCA1-like 7TM region domain-containing protein n=1 Tax=Talaromyces proteolyticus TaxID=1131652 RepID=A0AAD4KGH5_9EURO|nr:uncharacterized protein BGW36DRAFT_303366 [Talaromyces proteolyticus]KAH8691833.1 hypothetical protein BGW36DRAFT_303366 [Talaromyces proteolyticus]
MERGDASQPNTGEAQQSQGMSVRSFMTSLVIYGSICVGVLFFETAAHKRWYSKRFPNANTPPWSIKWPSNRTTAITCHGLDGFLFIRFLRTVVKIFLPLNLMVTGILLPIDLTADNSSTVHGLDRMTWANVQPGDGPRDWAHAVVTATAVVYICYVLVGEFRALAEIRQEYPLTPHPLPKLLLLTDIPKEKGSKEALATAYAGFGDGPLRISVNTGLDRRYLSAFLEFTNPLIPHILQQVVQDARPMSMIAHAVGSESDVIRSSLSRSWRGRLFRRVLFEALIIALCIFLAVPIGFTGMLSQISYLNQKLATWLGLIEGFLPQFILSILMIFFPFVLVHLVKRQGLLTYTHMELSLDGYYFVFLYIQVFLVVTISSSLVTVFQEVLKSPESVPYILATNIPKSSNYFYSYFLLQCIIQCAVSLRLLPHIFLCAKPWVRWRIGMEKTPVRWGLIYPVFSKVETGGLLYWRTLHQLFGGIYTAELCVFGLLILHNARFQAVFLGLVFIFTGCFQYLVFQVYGPVVRHLSATSMRWNGTIVSKAL